VLYGVGPASQRVTIGSLPDNVLVEIFDFYQVATNKDELERPWNWKKLVHVCQRWRYVIFGSPIRLNLQLFCTNYSPVRMLLDIWPPFPLVIEILCNIKDWLIIENSLIPALEHRDRVHQINIHIANTNSEGLLWERIVTAMEEPFPALKYLQLDAWKSNFSIPYTFLNGSAPCLQHLALSGISFPSLPRLLSSTSDLTTLHIGDIPQSGYISPVTMATCLSALPKLKSLSIIFISPNPCPERRGRPLLPPIRSVLPALTQLKFTGAAEYLQALAARIDAPLLDRFGIAFFHRPEIVFDIPEIIRFFGHLESFRSSSLILEFNLTCSASIFFSPQTIYPEPRSWCIKYEKFMVDRQVLSVAQICSQILPFCSGVKSLIINCPLYSSFYSDTAQAVDRTIWLQLFHSFPAVQSLYIPASLASSIAPALEGPANESAAEVFPSLQTLYIDVSPSEKVPKKGIDTFVVARGHSNHPVVVHRPSSRQCV
jgi:hypothetical protein